MKRIEQAIHRQIVAGLRAALPHGWIIAHIPNGGKRTEVEGAIFKALGVLPGMPDIMLLGADAHGSATAWFLEVKANNGRLTEAQSLMHDRLKDIGFQVATVRSWDEALKQVRFWNLPLRLAA
jgi:hypothetical protein